METFEKGLKLCRDTDDRLKSKKGEILGNISSVHIDNKRYEQAIKYLELAKPYLFDGNGSSFSNKTYFYENLLRAQVLQSNNSSTIESFEKYISFNDSLVNKIRSSIDNEMLAKYQADLKDVENEKLKIEKSLKESTITKQKILLWLSIFSLVVFILLMTLLYRQLRLQKKQKEQIKLLNKELNHRVKNNLAFMTSLLEMQARRTETAETKALLQESQNRLLALSQVHNTLFQNNDNVNINLKIYLEEIMSHLKSIFQLPAKPIHFDLSFIDYQLNAEDAMRFGLIINELVTNSVKHAFDETQIGVIRIKTFINNEHKLVLNYSDNGPGKSHLKNEKTQQKHAALGLKLINLLRKQLSSNYQVIWS